MPSVFSLDSVPVNQRFSAYRDQVETYYVPVSVKCDHPERFNAWINGTNLGAVTAGTSLLGEQDVDRRTEHIARSEDDRIKLIVPLSGAIYVAQDSKHTLIRPGEFYVTDPARPYQESIVEDLTFIFFLLPRNLLTSKISRIEDITAIGFDRERPYARLAVDFAHSLSIVLDAIEQAAASQAGIIASDLFVMALWERMDEVQTHATVHRTAQFRLARAFIDRHLADVNLDLGKVATAMQFSTRYLHGLLSEGGLNYRQYVLERRLTQCAKDLTTAGNADLSIAEIASRWGFSDNAHFSRSFKSFYGMSPRDYRASNQSR
ncbi:AraC-like ligand-binding domain-containing protein [Paraburkholderia dipogonis]|uniref:AraC-like ligand-binding domain-containing protein n=1 Tax=Paraburkholderia dipogonis TaxID=1211383 RepID=UPI0038BB88D9